MASPIRRLHSMAWTADDIGDQHGRVAVVTGGNGGLGFETARQLARKGAAVVLAARNLDKAAAARRRMEADTPAAVVEIRALDLASLASVRDCADGIVTEFDRVDLLVNNAGLMGIPKQVTADGFEMQFGVNHLGHFVLTRRLLPALLAAPSGRVVTVTSFARLSGRPVDPDEPHFAGSYDPWRAYGQSKLANLHFAVELQRRLEAAGTRVVSVAAHPGLSHTDLQARSVRETGGGPSQRFWHLAARLIGMPADRGALPLLRAATETHVRGGDLYGPRWGVAGPPVRKSLIRAPDRRAARILWEVSERETGEPFDITTMVTDIP